jgi:phosphoglycerate kinase
MQFKKITDIQLKNQIVFIRTDMNVPIQDGQITDNTRIKASLSTIQYALKSGAKVIIATHLGRPNEGTVTSNDSVDIIAKTLSIELGFAIPVITNIDNKIEFPQHNLVMLENVRCNIGEKANSMTLGQKYANLCDIFVHDAFATAHRAEASTDAVGKNSKVVCAGLLMTQELEALSKAVLSPKKPIIAIVAGSKVSTKLPILNNLANRVDYLIVGGGILNTFLLANGSPIGKSLAEVDLVPEAKKIMDSMQKRGAAVPLPQDVIVANKFSPDAVATEKPLSKITTDDMILDIGTAFADKLSHIIKNAATIIWNGPVGVFEFDQFANGTKVIANAIANSNGFSLAGGGDTIAAINKFNLMDKISYVSTAGGALLEFLEGRELPAVTLLTQKSL